MRLTTVDLRFAGDARQPSSKDVKEAVKGVSFAASGGTVGSFAFPEGQ